MNNFKTFLNKMSNIDYLNKDNIYIIVIILSIIVYNNYLPIIGDILSKSFSLLIIVIFIIYNFKQKRQSTATSLIFLLIVSIFNKANKTNIYDEVKLEKSIIDRTGIESFKSNDDHSDNDHNHHTHNDHDTHNNAEHEGSINDTDTNSNISDDNDLSSNHSTSDMESDKSSESIDYPSVEKKTNLHDTFKNLHDAIHQLENFVN